MKPNFASYTNVIATSTEPVTQLAVLPGVSSDATTTVYYAHGQYISQWTQSNGSSLFSGAYGFGIGSTYPISATSLSVGGANVVWSWCDTSPRCWVGYRGETDWIGFGTLTGAANGARQVVGDSTRIFYVDNSALERFSY